MSLGINNNKKKNQKIIYGFARDMPRVLNFLAAVVKMERDM